MEEALHELNRYDESASCSSAQPRMIQWSSIKHLTMENLSFKGSENGLHINIKENFHHDKQDFV